MFFPKLDRFYVSLKTGTDFNFPDFLHYKLVYLYVIYSGSVLVYIKFFKTPY